MLPESTREENLGDECDRKRKGTGEQSPQSIVCGNFVIQWFQRVMWLL
jgi:hypothetical protein